MIAIIDYGAGNLGSVQKAFEFLGAPCAVTSSARDMLSADALVLPGVGAFGDCMRQLSARGLPDVIREFISSGRPFLGICLGMQLLFEGSEESGGVEGLCVLKGSVRRFPEASGLKVPHIGYNSVIPPAGSRLFASLPEELYYYFVHSYYCSCETAGALTAKTEYGIPFNAALEYRNISAAQFHPEKSGALGIRTLQNFIGIINYNVNGGV